MKQIKKRNRLLAVALSVLLAFGGLPTAAFAEGQPVQTTPGICEHHMEHTAECGYVEGQPCEHKVNGGISDREGPLVGEHSEDCYTDKLICGYKVNGGEADREGGLGRDVETETTASDSEAEHTHTQECYALDCPHERGKHDDTCGYAKAQPCGYTCEVSGKTDNEPEPKPGDETEQTACTLTEGCPLVDGHEGGCMTKPENSVTETTCTLTEGCTLPTGHEGKCVTEPLPEGAGTITVTAFDKLEDAVKQVPLNTTWDGLNLPATLGASGYTVADDIQSVPEPGAISIEGVTWEVIVKDNSPAAYEADCPDPCIYWLRAVMPEGYVLDEGTALPEIEVRYGMASRAGGVIDNNNYTFDPASGKLTVKTNEGTTSWRADPNIDKEKVLAVSIENSVTTIGANAFEDCISLMSIDKLPSGLTSIGNFTFDGCKNLTSIDLSNLTNLTSIGNFTFRYCTSLTNLDKLPSGLKSIGNNTFDGCENLTSIDLSNLTNLTSIGDRTFGGCRSLTSINLSNLTNLTSIGDFTFSACRNLTSIDLSKLTSLTSIGEGTFQSCTSLTNLGKLPSGLKSIGASAFMYCTNLTEVVIPENVGLLDIWAFADCSNLKTIVFLGKQAPEFRDEIFKGISPAPGVYVPEGASGYGSLLPQIMTAPGITVHPQDVTVTAGNTATFTVEAGGPPPSFQWQAATVSSGWNDVTEGTGGSTNSYTTPAVTTGMNGWQYRCIITNAAGTVKTNAVTLTTEKKDVFNAAVTGITLPAAGNTPDTNAAVDGSAGYMVGMVTWRGVLTADGKFDYGTAYTVEITLNAKQDYRFASFVTGTINDQTAHVQRKSDTEVVLTYTFGKTGLQKWAVTVKNGAGAGSYAKGAVVSITADSAPTGKIFEKWTADSTDVVFEHPNNVSTSFIMPEHAVTVTANFKSLPPAAYTVTVNNGTSNKAAATKGETVTITAETAPAGQIFDKWTTTDGVIFASENAMSTTFIMPKHAVTVTANFKSLPPAAYTVTVNNGTSDKAAATKGETVTITAETAPAGHTFDKWTTTDGVTFTSENAMSTTFIMPEHAVTVTANFKSLPPAAYTVTVNNGTSDKTAATKGETVTITAETAPAGHTFDKWTTTDGVTFANENAMSTTFTMPAKAVTITATYKNSGGGSSSSNNSGSDVASEPSKPAETQPNSPTTGVIEPEIKVEKDGMVKVEVSDKNIQNAIDKALAQARKDGTQNSGIAVAIDMTGLKAQFNTLPLTLSKAAYDKLVKAGVKILDIRTPQISLSLDLATLQTIHASATNDVTISAVRANIFGLPGELSTRPAYDLTITSGGKAISSFGGYVAITLPYALQAGEQGGNLQMAYVGADGKLYTITDSSYDADAKALIGRTNHFTVFGIVNRPAPAFSDIENHWAKDDILFVASRGLLSGAGSNQFSPNTGMTRGMFVTALGRLAGVNPASYQTRSFTDVKADAYYAAYVEWAVQKNIVKGTGEGLFSPDMPVTREQMAVMMTNYAGQMGYSIPAPLAAVTFTDDNKISAWAAKEVAAMQQVGIIKGKDGNLFDPQGNATRAEVSAVLRRFVQTVINPAAATGWVRNDSGHWLYYQGGKALIGWQTIGKLRYYFNADGVMHEGWKQDTDTNKWYYWTNAGAATGWREIGGNWYYFDVNGIMAVNTKIDDYEVGPDGARKINRYP